MKRLKRRSFPGLIVVKFNEQQQAALKSMLDIGLYGRNMEDLVVRIVDTELQRRCIVIEPNP